MLRSLTVLAVAMLAVVGAVAAEPPPVATAAVPDGEVTCVERDSSTGGCLLELRLSRSGDPPAVSAAVVGGEGSGHQTVCSRGSHYSPDEYWDSHTGCRHGLYGWYSQTYDCYFRTAQAVSPADDQVMLPEGYRPGDAGSVYHAMCLSNLHPDVREADYCFLCTPPGWFGPGHLRFLATEPDGFGGEPDPVPGLLATAVGELSLQAPAIASAPPAEQGAALVRLPVWLWNEVTETNWGDLSASAGPIGGVTVVAAASAAEIRWETGDGGEVRCDEGVPWRPGLDVWSPPCGHQYLRGSQHEPGGRFEITATTPWDVVWWTEGPGGPRGGEFALVVGSSTTLEVRELQVLTGGG